MSSISTLSTPPVKVTLSAPDPSINHNRARQKNLAQTGGWFVDSDEFGDWKKSSKSFLWLHGIPGCGKTFLASTIIESICEHCRLQNIPAVAYFYFDFTDLEKQDHDNMLRSLILQFSSKSSKTTKVLDSILANYVRQPTSTQLLLILRKMCQQFDEAFIILDALDECKERPTLLETIREIATWTERTENLHILATSRRERDIEKCMELFIDDKRSINIQSDHVNKDIEAYIREALENDLALLRWKNRPQLQEMIVKTLMAAADGM